MPTVVGFCRNVLLLILPQISCSSRGGSRNLKGGGGSFIVVVSWFLPTTPTFYCFLGKRGGVLPNFENNRRTPLDPLVCCPANSAKYPAKFV